MNERTVNIADFRCRETKSYAERPSFRLAPEAPALSLVVVRPQTVVQMPSRSAQQSVYDISAAPRPERVRARVAMRPISIDRRSKVLRFRQDEPVSMMIRREEAGRGKWRGANDGPGDLPPAA